MSFNSSSKNFSFSLAKRVLYRDFLHHVEKIILTKPDFLNFHQCMVKIMCKLIAAESKLFPCRKYLKKFILLPILPQHWPQLMSFLVFSRLNVVANILEPWPVYLDWSDPDDWSPWSKVWIQHQETTNISNSWSYYFENFILQFHEIFHEIFFLIWNYYLQFSFAFFDCLM